MSLEMEAPQSSPFEVASIGVSCCHTVQATVTQNGFFECVHVEQIGDYKASRSLSPA
jgi:hypothetical protein